MPRSLSYDMEPDVFDGEDIGGEADRTEPPAEYVAPTGWDYELEITDEVREAVRKHHEYHGDKKAKVARVIRDDDGFPFLLVRVVNERGERWRIIEGIESDGNIIEVVSCPVEAEADMIACFTGRAEGRKDCCAGERGG